MLTFKTILSVCLGQRLRTRSILLQAQGEGRPCPAELTQYKNCAVKPCYSWALGEWSPCRMEVSIACGFVKEPVGIAGFKLNLIVFHIMQKV